MPDITITPANVTPGSGAITKRGTAGATITAGQVVYLDATDGKLKLADADAALTGAAVGIALHGAATNQPLAYQSDGEINAGGTVAVGTVYVASVTPGGVAPLADLIAGDYVCILGVGKTGNKISMRLFASGIAIA